MPTTTGPPTQRLARAAGRLGLVAASLLVAVALVELGARWLVPQARGHALPRALFAVDEDLGWRLSSSRQARHQSDYFDSRYVTNDLGYRDEPRTPASTASYRMLLYGDSQIFGWGLPAEQRFSNLIEDQAARVEVWNLAVPGYGLDQQVLSYERDAASWQADAIILFVSRFTQDRLHYDYLFGFHKPSFRVAVDDDDAEQRAPRGRLPRRLLHSFPRWMHTPYLIDRFLTRADQRWRVGLVVPQEESAELLATVLGFAARVAAERGHQVFVVSSRSAGENEALVRLCSELGLEHLGLGLPADQTSLVWGPYDAHWNASANRMIADSLGGQIATFVGSRVQ